MNFVEQVLGTALHCLLRSLRSESSERKTEASNEARIKNESEC